MTEVIMSWNDWGEYKSAHNIVVEEVVQLENAQTLIVVQPKDGELPMPENQNPSKLTAILQAMLDQAYKEVGKPVRKELPSGLRVDFIVNKDGMAYLQLSREGVYPSDTEWSTVIGYFPEGSVVKNPPANTLDKFNYKGRCYLRQAWEVE